MTHRKPHHGGWRFGREAIPDVVFPVEAATTCPRKHRVRGRNALQRNYGTIRECRACVNANQWARRNGHEKASEETREYADKLYAKYVGMENKA